MRLAPLSTIIPAMLPMITTAALLHDVGKTRVPLEILNKPGRFESHELQEMRKHATCDGDAPAQKPAFLLDNGGLCRCADVSGLGV